MGAEAVRKLLNQLDLVQLSEQLRVELDETGFEAEEEGPDQSAEDRRVDSRQRQPSPSGWCWT